MKIIFDKKLYKKKAITEAISVFEHLGNFSIVTQKSSYVINVLKVSTDIKNIIRHEFCNHVLFLMNK